MGRLGPRTRLLFRAGDSWTADNATTIDSPGPGMIGSYGQGSPPAITYTGSEEAFFKVNGEDWRFVNLSLAGTSPALAAGIWQNPGGRRLLLLNVKLRDFTAGAFNRSADGWPHEQFYIVGGDIGPIGSDTAAASPTCNGIFLGARRSAVLGTSIHDFRSANGRTEHGLRVWYADRFVISHNAILDPPIHGLKLHAYGRSLKGVAADTQHVVISDNTFHGGREAVKLAPQDNESDEYVHDVVVERNTVLSNPNTVTCVFLQAGRVTLRNNLLIGTGGGDSTNGFDLERLNPNLPAPSEIRILNNTLWRSDTGNYAELVGSAAIDPHSIVLVRNNVVSLADARHARVVVTEPWENLTEDHNLLHHATADPAVFRDPAHGDFRLCDDSRTVNGGVPVAGVFRDFNDFPRPQRRGVDLGAFELGWTLSGTVTLQDSPSDMTGLPLTIEFRGANGDNVTRTTTLRNAEGSYIIEDVAEGTYDLAFTIPDWPTAVVPGMTFSDNVTGINAAFTRGHVDDNVTTDNSTSDVDGPTATPTPPVVTSSPSVTPNDAEETPPDSPTCSLCPVALVLLIWIGRFFSCIASDDRLAYDHN
jgi:hypothetical protein